MNYKRVLLIIGILILLAAVAFGMYKTYGQSYVATVNGERVSVGEFRLMLDTVGPRLEKKWGKKATDIVGGRKVRDLEKEAALESIVNYKIAAQKAKERGILLDSDELQRINRDIDNMISQNPKAKENIKGFGLRVSEFKKITSEMSLANKLKESARDEIKKEFAVTDEQARTYYQNNKELYTQSFDEIKERVRFDLEYSKALEKWRKQSHIVRNDEVYNEI